jgi:DNA-binding MarR family transcriptional regulator
MGSPPSAGRPDHRRQRHAEVKEALRDLQVRLAALHHQVSSRLEIRDVDLDCLDVVNRHGPLSPSALSRRTGLPPATLTGILDRLERGDFVVRERAPEDRRSVIVRGRPARTPELLRLYAGLDAAIDQLCAGYAEAELALVAEFLRHTARAGSDAATELAEGAGPLAE